MDGQEKAPNGKALFAFLVLMFGIAVLIMTVCALKML
jgi:hypothetical protein